VNEVATPISERLDANLAALRDRQPDVARQVTAVENIEPARVVTGRDGSDVILLGEGDGRLDWLGGSSMPTISAPALVSGYPHVNDNVLLASVGTGYEPPLLAERIAGHCAVFVYAANAKLVRMALSVCDFSRQIAAGRIVILCGDFAAALVQFFESNPGYQTPAHLWPLPHVARAEVDRVATEMRAAIPRVERLHAARIQNAARSIVYALPAASGDATRLWIGSNDFGPQTRQHADRVIRAANQLGWPAQACIANVPEHGSDVARIESAAAFKPSVALWINSCPRSMGQALAGCKHVAWYLESASLPAVALEGLADCPAVYAATETVRQLVLSHGADPDRTRVLEPGVDAGLFAPDASTSNTPASNRDIDVVIFADGCDISAASAGVGLESHVKLYTHFANLLANHPDDFSPADVDDWLSRCETESGCTLADVNMRRDFAALIARRLPPVLLNRATLLTLLDNRIQVRLYGIGWDTFDETANVRCGPIPPPSERAEILKNAAILAVSWLDGPRIQFALEALAAGCQPLFRRPDSAIFASYPQTGGFLADIPSFNNRIQFVKMCRDIKTDASGGIAAVASQRNRLLESHTTAQRLRAMVAEQV